MNYQNPNQEEKFLHHILQIQDELNLVIKNIETIIMGKRKVIEEVLMAICANGHVLLMDTPGVGKTLLSKALAKSIHSHFRRIQFTPDLLPSDITGVNIFNQKTREFEFQSGPIFTNILLADEINRAGPKTQSALLEAMEERQVSIDNLQYNLHNFFFVIATQNPVEHAGTYPLPAAQLDRFLVRLSLGYPDKDTELEILRSSSSIESPLNSINKVVKIEEVLKWQSACSRIYTSPKIDEYIVDLARATREAGPSGSGVSPRASLMLKRVAKASALLDKRDYVIPDDIHRMIKQVFAHRMVSQYDGSDEIVDEILAKVTL